MDGGPGRLPRTTFVDDPFFHHDPFDGFSRDGFNRDGFNTTTRDGFSRSPQPQRRFGSTPRLIDDDFFNDFEQGMPTAFGSLPRHRHTSRSPRPPTDRGSPSASQYQQQQQQYQPQQQHQQAQYPQHHQQQQQQSQQQPQERSIPVQRASPNSSFSSQTLPNKKSPSPKGAVEINNASSNYTNGELNPDRKQQHSAPDSPNATVIEPEIQVKKLRSQEATPVPKPQQQQEQPQQQPTEKNGQEEQQKPQEKAIPLPPPLNTEFTAAAEARRRAFNEKKTSVDAGSSSKLIHLLDEAERRVELLREMAAQLEQEKEQILDALNNVRINADFLGLNDHDREDIDATSERLLKRCKAVEVSVNTPRNEEQARALEEVNKLIQAVTEKMKDDLASARNTIEKYFNACCPDDEPGPIDQRFASRVIECTADDQKKIRRKLAQIIEQIDRAERVCNPPQ